MDKAIGKAIAYFRDIKQITQTGLADASGIKQPNISAYEAGRRTPSDETLLSIANALEVTVSQIRERAERFKQLELQESDSNPIYDDLYNRHINLIYRNNDIVLDIARDILIGLRVRVHDVPFEVSERLKHQGARPYMLHSRDRRSSMIESAVEKVIRDMFHDHGNELAERLNDELRRSNYTIEEIIENLRKSYNDYY